MRWAWAGEVGFWYAMRMWSLSCSFTFWSSLATLKAFRECGDGPI